MAQKINKTILTSLSRHTRKLGLKRFFKSMGYERCAELPFIINVLSPLFKENLQYIDIGSGDSILPTYLLKNTIWDITVIDKFDWIYKQKKYLKKLNIDNKKYSDRFHISKSNFLDSEFTEKKFDVITNISVIEHFEDGLDTTAMIKSSNLLKENGFYILSTLINECYPRNFFVNKNVYGVNYTKEPVFFQRHYNVEQIENKLIVPSKLREKQRIYFGEYDLKFFQKFLNIPSFLKPLKILYQWLTPYFAYKYLTYNDFPISDESIPMNTSSGIILILRKE